MKVFISWSGDLSHKIAMEFRDWLPLVVQRIDPYLSTEDIGKGTRWSLDVAKELEDSSYGILCVTRDNFDAPWLNFEAGALSKSVEQSKVSPFLFDVKVSEIDGPLLQFQSTLFEEEEVFKLLKSLCGASAPPLLSEDKLKSVFHHWWPDLKKKLESLDLRTTEDLVLSREDKHDQSEMLEKILELTQIQHKLLRSPEELLPREYIMSAVGSSSRGINPGALGHLRIAWDNLLSVQINEADGDTDPTFGAMRRCIAELAIPINYILRKDLGKFDSLRRRMSNELNLNNDK